MKRIVTFDKANQPYGFAQLDANSNISGNVTASFAANAESASYALTASHAINGGGTSIDTGSFVTTSSYNDFTGSVATTGSNLFTDNQAINAGSSDVYGSGLKFVNDGHAHYTVGIYDSTFVVADTSAQGGVVWGSPVIKLQIGESSSLFNTNLSIASGNSLTIESGSLSVSGSVRLLTNAPTNLTGSLGDEKGTIAIDSSSIYYANNTFVPVITAGTYNTATTVNGPWANNMYGADTIFIQDNGSNPAPQVGWAVTDGVNTAYITGSGYGVDHQNSAHGYMWLLQLDRVMDFNAAATVDLQSQVGVSADWKKVEFGAQAPKYRVYTALLNQNGSSAGAVNNSSMQDALIPGTSYIIQTNDNLEGDFTNVGAANNNIGTLFVATGTTPANWGSNTVIAYNTGSPVATVLENTIGLVWWEIRQDGVYRVHIPGYDITNAYITSYSGYNSNTGLSYTFAIDPDSLGDLHAVDFISRNISDGTNDNNILINASIEIRIYN